MSVKLKLSIMLLMLFGLWLMNQGKQETMDWIRTENRLPEERLVVETMSPDGRVQNLKRIGNLWFHSDGKMYVYYTPIKWRNTQQ